MCVCRGGGAYAGFGGYYITKWVVCVCRVWAITLLNVLCGYAGFGEIILLKCVVWAYGPGEVYITKCGGVCEGSVWGKITLLKCVVWVCRVLGNYITKMGCVGMQGFGKLYY